MGVSIGGIDVTDGLINTEFRIGVLERIVDKLMRHAPPGTLTEGDLATIRAEVLKEMQKKYPKAGISSRSQP